MAVVTICSDFGALVFWSSGILKELAISHCECWKPDEFSKSLDLWRWRNWKAWQQEALIPTWLQPDWGERSQPDSPSDLPVSQLSYLLQIVHTEAHLSIHAFGARSSFIGAGAVLSAASPIPHHPAHPRGDHRKCPQTLSNAYGFSR